MVSLGVCLAVPANASLLRLESVRDEPQQNLLPVLLLTDAFIAEHIAAGTPTLVHCVHGQSRSAAAVVSFLLRGGSSLQGAIDTLSAARPSLCINPGFLSQLHLLHHRAEYPAEYSLLTTHYPHTFDPSAKLGDGSLPTGRRSKCKGCGYTLFLASDVLGPRDCSEFIHANLDAFWRGHRPIHVVDKPLLCPGDKDYVLVAPPQWMHACVTDRREGVLCCPKCSVDCGVWRKGGVAVCDGYVVVDMCAIRRSSVR